MYMPALTELDTQTLLKSLITVERSWIIIGAKLTVNSVKKTSLSKAVHTLSIAVKDT